ncbi:MAG: hypothetical protein ACE5EQ_07910 [Phycisphaerae bacterium]
MHELALIAQVRWASPLSLTIVLDSPGVRGGHGPPTACGTKKTNGRCAGLSGRARIAS